MWHRPEPFDHARLVDLLHRWFRRPRIVACLGAWENFVYLVTADDRRGGRDRHWVLRLSEADRRSEDELRAELAWLQRVADGYGHLVSVPGALRSCRGRLVEAVPGTGSDDQMTHHAVVFTHLDGTAASRTRLAAEADAWHAWGRAIGALHLAADDGTAAGRTPPGSTRGRRAWHEDQWLARGLDGDDTWIACRLGELRDAILAIDGDHRDHGLVHADIQPRNVLVEPTGRLAVIDFDDACRNWFAYDLAVALNDVFDDLDTPPARQARDRLVAGYRSVRALDDRWPDQLGLLARWRRALDYVHYSHMLTSLTADHRSAVLDRLAHLRRTLDVPVPVVR